MIIKRKQAHPMTSPAGASNDAARAAEVALPVASRPPAPTAPVVEWSEETVESGAAPERRSEDRRNDRRRGYRRIEDKDLISKAYEEANAIRENAQIQGFEEGLQQSREAIEALQGELARLMSGREEALASVVHEIGALAVEVAARIIKTEVSCDETLVMALVKDTIQKIGRGSKSILIKLNPDDTAAVKKILKDDPLPNLNAELIIMDDPAVDAGSCIVETNSGLIDASFTTQLGILRKLFGGKAQHD